MIKAQSKLSYELGLDLQDKLAELEETLWHVHINLESREALVGGFFENEKDAFGEWGRLQSQLDVELGELSVSLLEDKDWKEAYKEHFEPWEYKGFHCVPVWLKDSYRKPANDVAIYLDPGMAFGTGNHETTQLCLREIVRFASESQSFDSLRVIDAGCGSGILAIAASLLGVSAVYAFDIDPICIEVVRENLIFQEKKLDIELAVSDLESGLENRSGELVVANIQADVLCQNAGRLLNSVAKGGCLVLSGILANESEGVKEHFLSVAGKLNCGGISARVEILGEWSCLGLRGF